MYVAVDPFVSPSHVTVPLEGALRAWHNAGIKNDELYLYEGTTLAFSITFLLQLESGY